MQYNVDYRFVPMLLYVCQYHHPISYNIAMTIASLFVTILVPVSSHIVRVTPEAKYFDMVSVIPGAKYCDIVESLLEKNIVT